MIQALLFKILLFILALDLVVAGILIVFLINARIIIQRTYIQNHLEIKAIHTAQNAISSKEAAEILGMTLDEFHSFCESRRINTPEERDQKKEQAEQRKQAETRRIMEEEAAWRAEQERIAEERTREQEAENRKRKARMRKFGI